MNIKLFLLPTSPGNVLADIASCRRSCSIPTGRGPLSVAAGSEPSRAPEPVRSGGRGPVCLWSGPLSGHLTGAPQTRGSLGDPRLLPRHRRERAVPTAGPSGGRRATLTERACSSVLQRRSAAAPGCGTGPPGGGGHPKTPPSARPPRLSAPRRSRRAARRGPSGLRRRLTAQLREQRAAGPRRAGFISARLKYADGRDLDRLLQVQREPRPALTVPPT